MLLGWVTRGGVSTFTPEMEAVATDCEITGTQKCIILLSSKNDSQYTPCLLLPVALLLLKEPLSDFFSSLLILSLLACHKYWEGGGGTDGRDLSSRVTHITMELDSSPLREGLGERERLHLCVVTLMFSCTYALRCEFEDSL